MKKGIIVSVLTIIVMFSIVYYYQSHLSMWGFNFSKKDLKTAIIQTSNHTYLVTDKEMVLKVADEVSKWKEYSKITTFPPSAFQEKHRKLLIQTKGNITYGGSFWDAGNNVLLDSNGSYWVVDYHTFSKTLSSAIKNATILN